MLDAESLMTPPSVTFRRKATGRVPLQPKNTPCNHPSSKPPQPNPKPNPQKSIPISPINDANNKENRPDFAPPATDAKTEVEASSMDASLAEELNAVRQRLERLRRDRDTTERMLRLRDRVFEIRLQELMLRGEFQKQLEIEVDRLYRLKQLHVLSKSMSPIRSLREREVERKSAQESSSQSEMKFTRL